MGEVVDCRVGGFLVCLLVLLAALAAGSDLDGALMGSSVFFLPSPNSPRILFFFSGSLAPPSAAPLVDPVRTFSAFWDFGSNGSARAGAGWFDEPLCSGAELARLIVGAGYQVQIAVLQGRDLGSAGCALGFLALEMDAGRVWKPLTTTRSGSAEKLQQRDKEVLLQAQDRDQTQARRLVVPGAGKSPVVDGGRVGRRWECAQGRTGRCCSRRRRQSSFVGGERATRSSCEPGLVLRGSFSRLKYVG
ncbi:hypothetical protein FJTKL_04416 [Diaporthe vaccinii]|uniref:Uncharacterized protein n=1 Tax=Diaporthe vaccinii TaxID=105482 RepID=A0ABR4DU06_9PEZI